MSQHRLLLTSCLFFALAFWPSACSSQSTDDADIDKGYDAAAKATVVNAAHKLTTYTCGVHKFEMIPPEGFEFRELTPDFGKIFLFNGKKHQDGKATVISVTVLVLAKGEALPPVQVIVDSALNPFKEHLSGYDRQEMKALTQNGKSFEGASFSGEYPDHYRTRGFSYVTQYNGAYFAIFGQDTASSFDTTMKAFMDTIRSLKIIE